MNIPKGTIIEVTVSFRAENACEVSKEDLLDIADMALDEGLNNWPDLSVRSLGYRIDREAHIRRRRAVRRRNAGDRQRTPEIPEAPAGGKAN